MAMVATAYEDSMTIVLPTNCEDAPRGLSLRGLPGNWMSEMETVGAIGSMSTLGSVKSCWVLGRPDLASSNDGRNQLLLKRWDDCGKSSSRSSYSRAAGASP